MASATVAGVISIVKNCPDIIVFIADPRKCKNKIITTIDNTRGFKTGSLYFRKIYQIIHTLLKSNLSQIVDSQKLSQFDFPPFRLQIPFLLFLTDIAQQSFYTFCRFSAATIVTMEHTTTAPSKTGHIEAISSKYSNKPTPAGTNKIARLFNKNHQLLRFFRINKMHFKC